MKPFSPALRSVLSVALALPLASCVYVKVRGDLPEDGWLTELVDQGAPTTFERCDDMKLRLRAFLWGKKGSLATSFACVGEDLDAYFEGVCANVARELEERKCHLAGQTDDGPHHRTLTYEGEERGSVLVAIRPTREDIEHPWKLEISWNED